MQLICKFRVICFLLPLLLIQPVAAQVQSLAELRTTQEKLTAEQQKQIADWLSEKIVKIADQKNLDQAIEVRTEIVIQAEGATDIFRNAYIAALNEALKAQLSRQQDNDILALSAAICLAQLPQQSNAALLEELLQHKSPAVRYWAVKGLSALFGSENNPDSARIIQVLAEAGAKESSAVVVAQIYSSFSKADPQLCLAALLKVTDSRLKGYQVGKEVGPQTELQAIATGARIWSKLDQAQQNALAQRLGELLAWSGMRYTHDYNELTPGLRMNLERIVIASEALLNQMAQARQVQVGTPLSQALQGQQADRLDRISAALDAWTGVAGAEKYHLQIFQTEPVAPLK